MEWLDYVDLTELNSARITVQRYKSLLKSRNPPGLFVFPCSWIRMWIRFPGTDPYPAVLRVRIRIRIHRIHMFLGLLDPDPSIIKQI